MAQNSVYIKDMPYEFLKTQQDAYFDSPEFLKHGKLFDSKKAKAPLMEDRDQAGSIPEVIIDQARLLIARRYMNEEPLVQNESDLTGLIYVRMMTKVDVGVKTRRKLLRQITRSLSTIRQQGPTTIRRLIDRHIVRQMRASQADKSGIPVPAVTGVRPEKTANVVKDVVATSKFYQSDPSVEVLDDVKHRTLRVNRALQEALVPSDGQARSQEVFRDERTELLYEFRYDDLSSTIDLVRRTVRDRYSSSFNGSVGLSVDAQSLREMIRMNARGIIQDRPRFALYTYNTSVLNRPSNEYDIHHRLGGSNLTSGVLVIGKEYLHNWVSPNGEDNGRIYLPYEGNAVVTVLCDREQSSPRISKLVGDKTFKVREFIFGESKSWQLDFEGLDEGFILETVIDDRPYESALKTTLVGPDRLVVEFLSPRSGKVYLMANSENATSNIDIVVTPANVRNVLAGHDFRRKVFKVWN
jgi:hypothetical protein